jgi:hypothetical protein
MRFLALKPTPYLAVARRTLHLADSRKFARRQVIRSFRALEFVRVTYHQDFLRQHSYERLH